MRVLKNSIKKMMALCLAAIMTLAMATTAFAADAPKGTLTVKVNKGNTLKDQTVSLYKLFDLTVNGDNYAYTVNDKYKTILKELLNLGDEATDADYYNAVAGKKDDMQKFADVFTAKVLTVDPAMEADATSGKLGEVTEHTFNNLDYGYYLVYQTGTKELQSSLVSVKAESNEVALKGQTPSIEKEADKETVEIGQIVTYTIKGSIPDTTGYREYVYKIHDTLTAGLDFVEDTKGIVPTGTDYKVSVKIGNETATEMTAQLSGENNRTMELDLSEWIRDNQVSKGKEFTVTYYAKVNTNAVVETKNSASLEYGNKPGDTTTTTPDEVVTPTYPLDVNKTDTQGNMLAEAVFRLYKNQTDAEAANDNAIRVTGTDGSYTVAVDQTTGNMDMTTVATAVATGYNLHLNGLAAGDYWLVETQAPDGYNKLTAPIKVTITKTGDATWTISKNETEETDKIIDIENSSGTILPGTGGMGTVMFTVIAVVMILGVAISFIRSRRIVK